MEATPHKYVRLTLLCYFTYPIEDKKDQKNEVRDIYTSLFTVVELRRLKMGNYKFAKGMV